MANITDPLVWNGAIVTPEGMPTTLFLQQWNKLRLLVQQANLVINTVIQGTSPITVTGTLKAGGPITIALGNIAATTFLANATGVAAPPTAISVTTATAMLNVMTGDSGAGGLKGLVPAQAIGDAAKFLRGDGTWQPAGGGGGTGTSAWVLAATQVTNGADHYDITGLTGAAEILVVFEQTQTGATSTFRGVQLSDDNGATFKTGATDYSYMQATGARTQAAYIPAVNASSNALRDGYVHLQTASLDSSAQKLGITGDGGWYATVSLGAVNAIRIMNSGAAINYTTGTVYVFTRSAAAQLDFASIMQKVSLGF